MVERSSPVPSFGRALGLAFEQLEKARGRILVRGLAEALQEGGLLRGLRGRLAVDLPAVGPVHGTFIGTIDLATGALEGAVLASLQNAATGQVQQVGVGFSGRLRPWRRVNVQQTADGVCLGGFTVQVQGATPGSLDAPFLRGTATRVTVS